MTTHVSIQCVATNIMHEWYFMHKFGWSNIQMGSCAVAHNECISQNLRRICVTGCLDGPAHSASVHQCLSRISSLCNFEWKIGISVIIARYDLPIACTVCNYVGGDYLPPCLKFLLSVLSFSGRKQRFELRIATADSTCTSIAWGVNQSFRP